ncbi:hypothetical protein Si131_01363 [Streptococcus infantarius subsp. infantarius]|nr:hypothetical protein [Streptococcus infantarius subsp. infantarius]
MAKGDKSAEEIDVDGVRAVKLIKGTTTANTSWSFVQYQGLLRNLIKPDTKYTLSFDVNPSQDVTLNATIMKGNAQSPMTDYHDTPKALANKWSNVNVILTARTTLPEITDQIVYLRNFPTTNGNAIMFKNIKLEEGENQTPYSAAPEDLGWSATTLVPTQQQRYLWKFEYIYYSDGSVEVTSPINISIAGADGTNGQTSHVHFAFADNATGGGFSLTTPKEYMGWYVDFTEADSNDPTKYRWAKWKGSDGAQGIPGTPGADGKTPYIHFAYADDDKGTNFSLTDNNQQFQGYYSDYTQADSTDYTKYKWVDRLANIKGGSRNYFKNSLSRTFNTTNDGTFDFRTFIVNDFWKNKDRLKKNFVKISFDITFPAALTNDYIANIHFSATPWYSNKVTFKAGTTSRQHFEFAIDLSSASENYYTDNVFIRFGTNYGFPSNFKIILENMMLSIGSYYPDYIQAIEDTQEQIDSKADSSFTQEQLNALEAKRLQMEVELKAKATLEQVSELETFINNLKQEDTDGRQKIIEITKAIEERVKDIEPIMEYSKKLQFMDTYITQGNGGMVIGANDSTTKVVVTPDRISFQSGGSEVAYISQRMLHIDNGVFTMSLQLGHYITRAHPKNEYVNATYFVK